MYRNLFKKASLISQCLFLLAWLSSCATVPIHPPVDSAIAYAVKDGNHLLSRHAPVFVIEKPSVPYNRIGTPSAIQDRVFVDPDKPTLYTRVLRSGSEADPYTHLFYRIHFEKVPVGIIPFYIGAGNNVGLIVIVSLNGNGVPVLYTTVHTCGCYLAFVPTTALPRSAYPENWPLERQSVYSENLPGRLTLPEVFGNHFKTMILIRDGSHRVKDIWLADVGRMETYKTVATVTANMETLKSLPLKPDGGTTSFYETAGPRTGYVKGSHKLFERLFMSWWSFDWRVGEDKNLGRDKSEGPVFYTSLKPWYRDASDMRDFPAFLKFWGWRL